MGSRLNLNGCSAMPTWEYLTTPLVIHNTAAILNNWGEQGWELVQQRPGLRRGCPCCPRNPGANQHCPSPESIFSRGFYKFPPIYFLFHVFTSFYFLFHVFTSFIHRLTIINHRASSKLNTVTSFLLLPLWG